MRYCIDAKMMENAVFVVSHPRSGTHLMIDTLRKNFKVVSGSKPPLFPASNLFLNENHLRSAMQSGGKLRFWGFRKNYPIIKSHIVAEHEDWEKYNAHYGISKYDGRLIYVYRNPLKVLLSYYSYEMNRGMIPRSFNAFISQYDGHPVKQWRRHVEGYIFQKDVFAIEYDKLLQNPENWVSKLESYLKFPRSAGINSSSLLPAKPEYNSYELLKARVSLSPESTATMAPKLAVGAGEIEEAREYISSLLGDFLEEIRVVL